MGTALFKSEIQDAILLYLFCVEIFPITSFKVIKLLVESNDEKTFGIINWDILD